MRDQTFNAILMTGAILFALYTCNSGTEDLMQKRSNESTEETRITIDSSSSTTTDISLPETTMNDSSTMVSTFDTALNFIDTTSTFPSDSESSNEQQTNNTLSQQEIDWRVQQSLSELKDYETYKMLADQKRYDDSISRLSMDRLNKEEMDRQLSAETQRRLNDLNSNSTYTTIPNFSSGTNPNVITVDGYYRSNGTYVPSYHRTAPNNTARDNFSTYPNYNPYTGKTGSRRN